VRAFGESTFGVGGITMVESACWGAGSPCLLVSAGTLFGRLGLVPCPVA